MLWIVGLVVGGIALIGALNDTEEIPGGVAAAIPQPRVGEGGRPKCGRPPPREQLRTLGALVGKQAIYAWRWLRRNAVVVRSMLAKIRPTDRWSPLHGFVIAFLGIIALD